jgi:hypothetical protein
MHFSVDKFSGPCRIVRGSIVQMQWEFSSPQKGPPGYTTWTSLAIITSQKYVAWNLSPRPNHSMTNRPFMHQRRANMYFSLVIVLATRNGAHRRTSTTNKYGSLWDVTITHPSWLRKHNPQFLPFSRVPAITDTSRLFSLSSGISVCAACNKNDEVWNRETCANDVGRPQVKA